MAAACRYFEFDDTMDRLGRLDARAKRSRSPLSCHLRCLSGHFSILCLSHNLSQGLYILLLEFEIKSEPNSHGIVEAKISL